MITLLRPGLGQLFLAFTLLFAAFATQAQSPVQAGSDLPIHDAARLGSGSEVEQLLKANPALRDIRNGMGSTPLHLAATNGDVGPLKALLAAGAEVNVRDKEGITPLHLATYADRATNALLLLRAGADANAVTDNGRSVTSMGRKTMANETVGVISLWLLKGCKPGMKNC